tara:strand:+ start:401 stop:805 length:405 start_codon:yes stop_codon:yes gene_type:complete
MSEAPQRLKRRHEFLRVARGGGKCAMPGLVLQAYEPQIHPNGRSADIIRVGFTVTKRVGNSVVRNRVRRRLRAAANVVIQEHAAKGNDYVIIGRFGTTQRKFNGLVKDLESALQKLGKWRKAENEYEDTTEGHM